MNLTANEISGLTAMQLCLYLTRLQVKEETASLTIDEKEEMTAIDRELRGRVVKILGRDFRPSIFAPKPKPGTKIKLNVVVTSSVGSKVTEFGLKVYSKDEAHVEARKIIRELGLNRVSYKIR